MVIGVAEVVVQVQVDQLPTVALDVVAYWFPAGILRDVGVPNIDADPEVRLLRIVPDLIEGKVQRPHGVRRILKHQTYT